MKKVSLEIFAAILSGVLLTLCHAPWNQAWLAWLALTPLLAVLWLPAKPLPPLRCAALGYACGLVFFWGTFYWIWHVTVAGWLLLPFYLALFPALWAWFAGCVARPAKALSVPANHLEKSLGLEPPKSIWLGSRPNLQAGILCALAWTAQEWLRGWLFTGFGWNGLGVALHENIAFLQLASLTGVGGLSFLLALSSATAVFTVKRVWMEIGRTALRPHYDFNLTVAIVVLAFSYGIHRVQREVETFPLKVAALQADIAQDQKWDAEFEEQILETYESLQGAAAAMNPELIVWPEAATPRGIFNDQTNNDFVSRLAGETDAQLLMGTLEFDAERSYNAVALLGVRGRGSVVYHKMHLVPFGEYIPFRKSFPLFAMIIGDLVPSDFNAGTEPSVLKMEKLPVRIAPLICFEDTVGRLVRQFAPGHPNLLVNVTNDGWFKHSAGAEQHLHNAIFRTVENDLPMVRSANTGVTCIIDRQGRVRQSLRDENGSHFLRGTLMGVVEVPRAPEQTLYMRTGEWFSVTALIICALAAVRRQYEARI